MICLVCQNLLMAQDAYDTTATGSQTKSHHRTCISLKNSVEMGCYVCNRLWATLAPEERHPVSTSHDSDSHPSSDEIETLTEGESTDSVGDSITAFSLADGRPYGHPGCYKMGLAFNTSRVLASEEAHGRVYWRATFLLQPHNGSITSNITKNLAPTTKSAETLSLAKNWIADCTANHQQCNIVIREKRWYPTRLLNFELLEDSHTCCRLVETSTAVLDGPYMTLSHCWGLADCLKLTTDNYDQLLSGISLSLLPQLYQDAFYIARCLNIKNLWIDSLCIIQLGDDFADWRREVALMSDIYLNSFCNISSVDAPDGDHSMFCSRNPDALHPEVVSLFVDGRISPYLISDSRFWDTDVSNALLNTRAWVLQERLLSPRILHFGAQQMLWECREKDAAEIYPDGLPPAVFSSLTRFKNVTPHHYIKKDKTDISIAAYHTWMRIVEAYTACSLTFPNDKIVALSAIAKMMRTTLCDEYVAGMWRHYLERELLWSACRNRSGNPLRPQTYRAPSWSWMAVDGKINPGLPNIEASDMLMKVDGLQLEYLTDDNTGSIRGGWLRLRGVLKQLMLMPHRASTGRNYEDWNMVVNGVHISCPSDSAMREPQPHVTLDAFHEDFDKQNAEAALYCMPGRARKGNNGSIYVLLLVLDDREKGIFRRIGLARGWGEDMKEKILARSGEEDKFPCEEYRDGLHLIRII